MCEIKRFHMGSKIVFALPVIPSPGGGGGGGHDPRNSQ